MAAPQSSTPASAPVALTIAGSDSGANAGVQADLLAFAAQGVYGTTALTCLTAQNPQGISQIHPAPPEFVVEQAKQVAEYFAPVAAKTGMLFSREIIESVADFFHYRPSIRLVIDPVMVATSGQRLMQQDAIDALMNALLPLATVITPNLDEAQILVDADLRTRADFESASKNLAQRYQAAVLIKGGHLQGNRLYDVLCEADGEPLCFEQERIKDIDTHGSGCTLSAAIAAHLAKGRSVKEAVERARAYLRAGMEQALPLGGIRFINHFPKK